MLTMRTTAMRRKTHHTGISGNIARDASGAASMAMQYATQPKRASVARVQRLPKP